VKPPLKLSCTGDKDADIFDQYAALYKVIEDIIREYPEQWFWFHQRVEDKNSYQPQFLPIQRVLRSAGKRN